MKGEQTGPPPLPPNKGKQTAVVAIPTMKGEQTGPPPLPPKKGKQTAVVAIPTMKGEQTGPPPLPKSELDIAMDTAKNAGEEFAKLINDGRIANNKPKIPLSVL
jgi:hypothetical protein